MEQTLRQLGQLLLGSIPTIILLATLYVLYTFLVYRPLRAVLAERRKRTEGAMEKARADIAAAEALTSEYEQRLREARQKVFRSLEMRRQKASQARNEAVNQARSKAQDEVKRHRAAIEQDKQEAMARLEGEAGRLASEIVRTVLRPLEAPSQVSG
jgi:F-type H+-transporting ATPase subunit b